MKGKKQEAVNQMVTSDLQLFFCFVSNEPSERASFNTTIFDKKINKIIVFAIYVLFLQIY